MNLNYGAKVYVFLLTAMVPSSILRGYALATMWRWFVVPLGVSPIGWAHAYGLAALAQIAVVMLPTKDSEASGGDRDATDKERSRYIALVLTRAFLPSLVVLLVGYVTHEMMGLR